MRSRRVQAVLAGLIAFLALASCAKKHVAHNRAPAPRNGSEVGLASWYGHPYHGRPAANGEIYDMEKLTAAHRTLPFGAWVRVTNLSNDKSVEVRIIDRGPFVAGRIIDLSHAAAQAIELIGPGVAEVRVDLISEPRTLAPDSSVYAVQAGAFEDHTRADRLQRSMEREYGTARLIMRNSSPPVWRVLVGASQTLDQANSLAQKIQTELGAAFVVRVDDSAFASGSSR